MCELYASGKGDVVWLHEETLTNFLRSNSCHEAITEHLVFQGSVVVARINKRLKLSHVGVDVFARFMHFIMDMISSIDVRLIFAESLGEFVTRLLECSAIRAQAGEDRSI